MLRLILLLIVVALFVRALARLIGGILEGAGYRQDSRTPSVKLVRDPVCGIFVVPSQALSSGSGDSARYFCSEKCRRAWDRR
jgi:YHS domain-containing protein